MILVLASRLLLHLQLLNHQITEMHYIAVIL
jgi:hypothetical protein